MKEKCIYYQDFLNKLQKTIPQQTNLANKITEILLIEKDAVYRRLRGDVLFTFSEIASIARHLNISLDGIIGSGSSKVRPVRMQLIDYVNPSEQDYRMLEEYCSLINIARDTPQSEFAEASNSLPLIVYLNFDYLTRFNIFKWSFQSSVSGDVKPFHKIEIPERLILLNKEYNIRFRHFANSYFLWDSSIFRHIVSDIRYFEDMGLIYKEDVQRLKEELQQSLDYVNELNKRGRYSETDNKVHVYISDIDLDAVYTYVDIPPHKITIFKSFTINTIASVDEVVFNHVKSWINTLLRTSTIISVSNEKQRIMFVNQQREIIDSL
jgi:hypothetical protein